LLATNDKLDNDYKKYNQNVEQAAENGIKIIREQTAALKDKAAQIGEALLNSSPK
jgi:uncharacterized protein YdcH (DUF465 family)